MAPSPEAPNEYTTDAVPAPQATTTLVTAVAGIVPVPSVTLQLIAVGALATATLYAAPYGTGVCIVNEVALARIVVASTPSLVSTKPLFAPSPEIVPPRV